MKRVERSRSRIRGGGKEVIRGIPFLFVTVEIVQSSVNGELLVSHTYCYPFIKFKRTPASQDTWLVSSRNNHVFLLVLNTCQPLNLTQMRSRENG